MATDATLATRFLTSLEIPEGPLAGRPLKLAPFQKSFLKGALADGVNVACLSVGRGNGKTALSAGLALGALLGVWDAQPRREILIGARTRDQGRIAWTYIEGLARSLPDDIRARLQFRRSPILSVTLDNEHEIRVLPADGKSALGTSPTFVLMDERGHWALDRGDSLEHALLTGLGKRGGRALIISTSASDDSHPFSRWLDEAQVGVFSQEHRPAPSLPADDRESLMLANPGAEAGIGASVEWLKAQGRRAIARGGSTLTSYRLFHRNERVSGEARDVLLTTDEWLNCEVSDLPAREGACVIGVDLGGSASMSAAAFFWPATGRLECLGTFPSKPSLLDRGQADGVSARYCEMQDRGELDVLGEQTVPVAPWLNEVARHVQGYEVAAIVADRYKQAELGEAIDATGLRFPIVWRGQGFRDGGEDCERFRRAAFDGQVKSKPSLLLRSAFADAVCLRDPANNLKLAKARSNGRIDAAAATVIAVAQGARMVGRATATKGRMAWG
ncbi:terminase large subunit [Acuticoccus sp. MNP-M23]|uniref:terminase TerL endonuclease subunit n=1 Tax=Acuticoccus sp. MNP-M23 TaxID=3072793 RepID=UPI00281507D0|nr:terminase TerL endonuclease subunit [Acuticoccus sp. MNP-M23]WMS43441.1 terminase large subunit [Acuticoccus sp. MNP-M23]